jgi:transposase
MARGRERQLHHSGMDAECLAVLESMKKHWKGLQVFVDHPHIPMDNSEAERKIRPAAVGRKNYYGSGSLWSASLTACLFSLFQTLVKWNINPRTWLQEYLTACAQAGGVPKGLGAFLPWRMSEGRRTQMGLPRIRGEPSPCTPRGIA